MYPNRLSREILCLLIGILVWAVAPAPIVGLRSVAAQKKTDQGEVKLSTELVQIDVLVTDKNNRPVSGLKREDFELYDNNKTQQITNFSFEEIGKPTTANQQIESNSIAKAITAGEVKRVMAFVVDTLHIKYENIYRTRKLLDDFVDNKMQPGDLVLILPTGGGSGVLQQFTSDRRMLHRAIERLRPFYFSTDTTPYRSFARMAGPPAGMGGRGGISSQRGGGIGQMPDPLEEADVRATLSALNETIKSMSKLPGRKISMFVSEGLRIFSTQATSDLDKTTGLAARANVVFYTIDPRGLDPLIINAGDELDQSVDVMTAVSNASDQKRDDFRESQDSLRVIANETGGKFFGNNNDINRGMDTMLQENTAYYMLGFYPESGRWDGKLHKVKVVVRNRSDLTVTFRKNYLARTQQTEVPAKLDPKVAEAVEAISSPLVRRDLDLRLTPLYTDNAQREPVVTLLLHIDATKLSFAQSEGRFQNKLEELGFVLDARGKAVDSFSNIVDLNLQPKTHEDVLKHGLLATRSLNVKPGVYQVRLFVRDSSSGLVGTANDYIEIPDMKANHLSTSSLFVSGQAVEDGKIVNTAGEGGTASQRRFSRDGEFMYSIVVYNPKLDGPKKEPQLEMRTRILKGSRVIFKGEIHSVVAMDGSSANRIITGGMIKPASLQPDDYTLEVTVRDKLRGKDAKATIRQEMDFTIE
jgi:VWFA-related protein